MVKLKVTTVGNSTGVVLPKEVLARLKVEKGDTLYLTEAPEGYRITPYNPSGERFLRSSPSDRIRLALGRHGRRARDT